MSKIFYNEPHLVVVQDQLLPAYPITEAPLLDEVVKIAANTHPFDLSRNEPPYAGMSFRERMTMKRTGLDTLDKNGLHEALDAEAWIYEPSEGDSTKHRTPGMVSVGATAVYAFEGYTIADFSEEFGSLAVGAAISTHLYQGRQFELVYRGARISSVSVSRY